MAVRRKKSAPILPEPGPDFFTIGLGDFEIPDFIAGKKLEAAFRMRGRQGLNLDLHLEQKHQPMRASLIPIFADDSRQVQITGSAQEPRFFARFAAGTDVRGFAEIHLQLAARGAPEAAVGFLRPLQQQDLILRIEAIQQRGDFVRQTHRENFKRRKANVEQQRLPRPETFPPHACFDKNSIVSPAKKIKIVTSDLSMNSIKIAVLAGDGIGPEVMREAIKILRTAGKKFGFITELTEAPVGWAGIDAAGKAWPEATLELCKKSDAILFGSVGLPDRDPTIPKEERPERAALLRIRKEFGLYANLRPVRLPRALAHACPLTPERQGGGIDILVIRELTGGIYFGQPKRTEDLGGGNFRATDTLVYTTTPKLSELRKWPSRRRSCGGKS